MKMKPILFSTHMVQAILAGRKTQTRRLIKNQPKYDTQTGDILSMNFLGSPGTVIPIEEWQKSMESVSKIKVGDILWVRENCWKWTCHMAVYSFEPKGIKEGEISFNPKFDELNGDRYYWASGWGWKRVPSIHMPFTAARIFLKVTNVRVERVCDITVHDAINEGIQREWDGQHYWYKNYMIDEMTKTPITSFQTLWTSINGPETWNNWVFVYDFDVTEKPAL